MLRRDEPREVAPTMIIPTPRLVLREFTVEDWPAVLAYQSSPQYLRYYPAVRRTPRDARTFVALCIAWQRASPRSKYQLAITLRDDGRLIGNVGIRKPSPEATVAELGYELAPAQWGQSYATEAASAMLRFAFEHLALHRVHAHCIAENVASARVLKRIGMRFEGRLREDQWFKGRWWDTLLYGILDREWRALPEGDTAQGGCAGSADGAPIGADSGSSAQCRATRFAAHRRPSARMTWNRRRCDGGTTDPRDAAVGPAALCPR